MRINWDVVMESKTFVRLSRITHVSMADLDELEGTGLEIVAMESSYPSCISAITQEPKRLDPAGDLPSWNLLCRKVRPAWDKAILAIHRVP
jgi:hypothetical protein